MRIKEIRIKGLFDTFDHVIPLNLEERITILYGINGVGKTMIFRILNSIFNNKHWDLDELFALPFQEIELIFDKNLHIHFKKPNYYLYKNGKKESSRSALIKVLEQVRCFFIGTERLLFLNSDDPRRTFAGGTKTITLYKKDFSNIISEKVKKYKELSDELKSSLGQRVLSEKVKTDYSLIELKELAKKVEEERNRLKEVGLLELHTKEYLSIPDNISDLNKAILAVNIQDIQHQLTVFHEDNFYERLRLFIEILNDRRLSYKSISITEKEGFIFTTKKGERLNPSDLSSGEQHEVVLLYLLLFKIEEGALILLDEPEISLHVDWQMDFLDDMKEIVSLRKFDIMVATHSPSIINGHHELTVNLHGEDY